MVAEKYPAEPDSTVPSELLEVRQQPCGLTAVYGSNCTCWEGELVGVDVVGNGDAVVDVVGGADGVGWKFIGADVSVFWKQRQTPEPTVSAWSKSSGLV
jgi:hypothetical protein